MPTENRSSNTIELLPCPFCSQQGFLIERLDSDASVVICQGLTGPHEACLARGPVGVAQDEGEEQPGHNKAVELWNARAEQHQGEPVAWANWKVGSKTYVPFRSYDDAQRSVNASEISATQDGPYRVVSLYTHADPGEVERLRLEIRSLRQHKTDYMEAAEETHKALRAQLDERVIVPDGYAVVPIKPTKAMRDACRVAGKVSVWADMMAAALSASAEQEVKQ